MGRRRTSAWRDKALYPTQNPPRRSFGSAGRWGLLTTSEGLLTAAISADAPIDIEESGWRPGIVRGRAADGREVTLEIEPCAQAIGSLDAAMLVDRSSSMLSRCEGSGSALYLTKHEAVKRSLRSLVPDMGPADRLALREFNFNCTPVGDGKQTFREAFEALVENLQPPSGGTEVGESINTVIRATEGCDILLITDGMSLGLNVQHCAMAGRRISGVLVGEDSLEARVGHLAALTGGDLHFSFGADIDEALRATIQGLRRKNRGPDRLDSCANGVPEHIFTTRGNARIVARWSDNASGTQRNTLAAGVAAFAASLALARWRSRPRSGSQWARDWSHTSRAWCWSTKRGPARQGCQ